MIMQRRWMPIGCAGAGALAVIAMFLPWHAVKNDYRTFTDSGIDHVGYLPVALLGACIACAVFAAIRPTRASWLTAGIAGIAGALIGGGVVFVNIVFAHILSDYDALGGDTACGVALLAMATFASLVFAYSWRMRPAIS